MHQSDLGNANEFLWKCSCSCVSMQYDVVGQSIERITYRYKTRQSDANAQRKQGISRDRLHNSYFYQFIKGLRISYTERHF